MKIYGLTLFTDQNNFVPERLTNKTMLFPIPSVRTWISGSWSEAGALKVCWFKSWSRGNHKSKCCCIVPFIPSASWKRSCSVELRIQSLWLSSVRPGFYTCFVTNTITNSTTGYKRVHRTCVAGVQRTVSILRSHDRWEPIGGGQITKTDPSIKDDC